MGGRRLPAALAALALLGLGLDGSVGTEAALTATTATPVNSFSSAPDWLPPTVDAALVVKEDGGITGVIGADGTAEIYARASDTMGSGQPSGVGSVTAGVQGLPNMPLMAESSVVGGQTFTHKAVVPVPAMQPVPIQTITGWIRATDLAGNPSNNRPLSVRVDSQVPRGASVTTTNGTRTDNWTGRPDPGDTITFSWTEDGVIDPHSIIRNWNGAATNVTVRITEDPVGGDRLTVWNADNDLQLPLGQVLLGGDYVSRSTTFGASGTRSRMAMSASQKGVVVTLGTASRTANQVGAGTLSWTPSTGVFDHGGNRSTRTTVVEPGIALRDF